MCQELIDVAQKKFINETGFLESYMTRVACPTSSNLEYLQTIDKTFYFLPIFFVKDKLVPFVVKSMRIKALFVVISSTQPTFHM